MKKLISFIIICLFIIPGVFAFEDFYSFDEPEEGFRIKDRKFEMGFGAGVNIANDFLSVNKIFQDTVILDLDDLSLGLRMEAGAEVPWHFNINFRTWGVGLFAKLEATGALGLNGDMLSFKQATNKKSDFNSAVFMSIGVDSFFYIQDFKVRFKPAVFYPILYVVPDRLSYTYNSTTEGTNLGIDYDIRVYTAFALGEDGMADSFSLTASPGFDFSVGIEYPLSEKTGLKNTVPILDFDIGLDLVNIPIVGAKMNNYILINGVISGNGENLEDFLDSFDMEQDTSFEDGSSGGIERAFKMYVWANWYPLNGITKSRDFFTVTPVLGFAINTLYIDPFSMEVGIRARLNMANLFFAGAGINYEDRIWRNSLMLGINSRAFELNIGADLRSQDFLSSWTANGFDLNIGMKFGW